MKKEKKERMQAAVHEFKLDVNFCLAIRKSKTST
jgi:hypothetical protein